MLKPGMVFTIEPGVYIPEEKIGVRIECDFLVVPDGKLLDLDAEPCPYRRRSRSGDAEEIAIDASRTTTASLDNSMRWCSAFSDQLTACLEECAHGRRGLFSDLEGLAGEEQSHRAGLKQPGCANSHSRCRTSSLKRNSATRSAMSSSICARCMARAIPANRAWRACFFLASSAARWARRLSGARSHGRRCTHFWRCAPAS